MRFVQLLVFCFLSGVFTSGRAATPTSGTSLYASLLELHGSLTERKFLPFRMTSIFRHFHRSEQDSVRSDGPSKLAKISVWMLAVSYVSTMILGNIAMSLAYLGLAGILTANLLAILVLLLKPNKKSKKHARGVLIITGIMLGAGLLTLGLIKLLFPGAI